MARRYVARELRRSCQHVLDDPLTDEQSRRAASLATESSQDPGLVTIADLREQSPPEPPQFMRLAAMLQALVWAIQLPGERDDSRPI